MELKNETTETLQTNLKRTKRLMQLLTWIVIIATGFLVYGFFNEGKGIDSALGVIPVIFAFLVIMLQKKYKKMKTELESRK